MLISVISVLVMLPLVLADGWDDFSNNLATDLAPFLSLFGEQITKQYLSESITMMDYFIFVMAPMGILTAVVSAIRVCGSPSLRAFIGRAQEGGGDAEAELCSSTSRDVCELYNNGGIARVFGRPKILEIVYDPAEKPFDEETAGIYTFQEYVKNKVEKKSQHNWYRKTPETKESGCESGFISEIPKTTFAPNLSLNIGIKKQPPIVFWLIGLGGLVLQTGVLAFAIIVTYYLKWDKEDGLPEAYACPLFFIGTLLVCGGMFLCAFLVGQSTDEEVWCRKKKKCDGSSFWNQSRGQSTDKEIRYDTGKEEQSDRLSFFWMQPGGQIIGDQTFDAFCHSDSDSPGEGLVEYTTSWKEVKSRAIKHSDGVSGGSKHSRSANQVSWKNRLSSSEMQVWAAVGVTISGFVLQFTGLRALHSAISVAQLGITMIMSAARAGLRMRRLNPGANAFASFPDQILGHELDWLALRIGQQSVPERQGSYDNGQKYFWKFCGTSNVTDTMDREETSPSKDPSSAAKLLAFRTRLAQLTESLEALPKSAWRAQNFDIVMVEVRREAQRLAMAIEGAINVIFSQSARVRNDWRSAEEVWWRFQCTVSSLDLRHCPTVEEPQNLYLRFVRGRGGNWELKEKLRLEGLLGLWTWSLKSDPAAETLDPQGQFTVSKAAEIRAKRIAATEWTVESRDLKGWLKKEEIQLPDEPISLEPSFIGDPNIIWHEDHGIFKPTSSRPYNVANHRLYGWHGTDLQPVGTPNTTTVFKVWPVLTNNTLLSLCAQEVFGSFFASSLAILHDVGTIDSVKTDEDPLIENALISQMMELFTKTKFGSRGDALLCVLPSILGPVHRTPLSLAAMHGSQGHILDELRLNPAVLHAHARDRDERTALWWAIRNQRETVVEALLAEKSLENEVFSKGRTLLSIAAEIGHEGVLKLLLGTGKFRIDDKDEDEEKETPLSWAAKNGHEKALRLLLGYKITQKVLANTEDRTALSWAAQGGYHELMKLLLERDPANVDATDQDQGRTPLSWAAENGHSDIVQLLLDINRVNPDAKGQADGRTPLSWAAANGRSNIVRQLLDTNRVDPDAKDQNEGRTPLSRAAENGHSDVVRQLLDINRVDADARDQKEGRTPLSWAAGNGHKDVVQQLLETDKKVDPEAKDEHGRTPVSWAAGNGHEECFEQLLTMPDVDVDPDAKDKHGRTPFYWAVKNGQELFVQYFLDKWEVSAGNADHYKRTPLSLAAENGSEWIVELLLGNYLLSPDTADLYGRTPLSWAAKKGHETIVQLLLDNKHNGENTDEYGRSPLSWAAGNGHEAIVKVFLRHDLDPDSKDLYGRTPLSWAAENGHEGVVSILLGSAGVNRHGKDNYGRMPLSWAIIGGTEAVVKLLLGDERFEDVQDKYGRTILLWAIQNGPTGVVEALLDDRGIELDTKDRHGQTPLSWAARIGDETIVKLLLESEKVEPDSKDERGMTPLMWAAKEANKKIVLKWTRDKYSTADIASMDPKVQEFYKALMDHEEKMNPKVMAAFDEDERRKRRSVELARKERALALGEIQNKPNGAGLRQNPGS